MSADTLMSCPFCGAESDQQRLIEIDRGSWAATCDGCGAIGPQHGTELAAAWGWNGDALPRLGLAGLEAKCGSTRSRTTLRVGRAGT